MPRMSVLNKGATFKNKGSIKGQVACLLIYFPLSGPPLAVVFFPSHLCQSDGLPDLVSFNSYSCWGLGSLLDLSSYAR